jgi:hypothetical protein
MITNRATALDSELERRMEREFENVDDDDLRHAVEQVEDSELDDEGIEKRFARRLFELTQAHEDGRDIDHDLDKVLDDMEREYFFGGLGQKLKKAGARLVKKGMRAAKSAGAGAAVQALTSLARGNTKGLLKNLANVGINAALSSVPGGALAAPLVTQGLGFETNEDGWRTFANVARGSYDHLARSLTEDADQPGEAARLAAAALEAGLMSAGLKAGRSRADDRERRIVVRPGQRLIIEA